MESTSAFAHDRGSAFQVISVEPGHVLILIAVVLAGVAVVSWCV